MNKIIIKFFILITFLTINNLKIYAKTPIKIIKINNGDTVQAITKDGVSFNIRLLGLDCYESYKNNRAFKQAYYEKINIDKVIKEGEKAKNYLEKLYSNSTNSYFYFMGVDIYKRPLGLLYFDDINVNKKILDEKICKPYNYEKNIDSLY